MSNISDLSRKLQQEIKEKLNGNPDQLHAQLNDLYGKVETCDLKTLMYVYFQSLGLDYNDLADKYKLYIEEVEQEIKLQYGKVLLNQIIKSNHK